MNNPLSLDGKTILVTGAASGIGRATALYLSELGARLVLIDKNLNGLEEVYGLCATKADIYKCDLVNHDELTILLKSIVSNYQEFNGFVHVAGVSYISPLKTISLEISRQVLQVNTLAGLEIAKYLSYRSMIALGGSSFVFISSIYAMVGTSANCVYAISKAGIHGMVKALAIELASKKVRVNCVAPGFIDTEMMEYNQGKFDSDYLERIRGLHPLGLGKPDDIAGAIAFLLSDISRWITGVCLPVDGGYTAQ
jgi:NAD(P)-dependent dehydrogenase (short-subunit alcohol dehydrogenase family)